MKLSQINNKSKSKIATGKATIICNDGICAIDSNVDIMGIQIKYKGKAEIKPVLPEGWYLQGNNHTLIMFTLQSVPIKQHTLFEYDGLVEIQNIIVSNPQSQKVITLIEDVKPTWLNQYWAMEAETTTWDKFEDKSKKGIVNKTKLNLPEYDLPEAEKLSDERKENYEKFTRRLREFSRSTGGY